MAPTRLALLALALVALALPATASAAKKRTYYVSLGDSYAAGYQPNAVAGQGYTDFLYKRLHKSEKKLRLVPLGCSGANSDSMINGNKPCGPNGKPYTLAPVPYASTSKKTSQLTYATRWLRKHRGQVKYVTIAIGGNDFASCVKAGDIEAVVACAGAGIQRMKKNLPIIAKAVRKAAGKKVRIVGTTYPDVVLGAYVQSESGKTLAQASVSVFKDQINPTMKNAYKKQKIGFVDATAKFGSYTPFEQTTTLAPYGEIPVAVANICKLGWFCERSDIHLRSSGYKKLADLIYAEIKRRS